MQGAMRRMGLAARPPRPRPPPAASPMASAWWTTPPCRTLRWWWSRKQLICRVSSVPWRPKGRSVALRAETSSSCSVAAPVWRRAKPSGVYLQNPRMISRKVRDVAKTELVDVLKNVFSEMFYAVISVKKETECFPLDDSLTNIQWLGKMSSDGLGSESNQNCTSKNNPSDCHQVHNVKVGMKLNSHSIF